MNIIKKYNFLAILHFFIAYVLDSSLVLVVAWSFAVLGFLKNKRSRKNKARLVSIVIVVLGLVISPLVLSPQEDTSPLDTGGSRPPGEITMPFDESDRKVPDSQDRPGPYDESTTEETPPKALFEEDFTPVEVINVVDGDTIDVLDPLRDEYRVRLILVDTPETKHPRRGQEFYGIEASHFTKETLLDRTVYLEQDVSETDRFGRVLAYVWLDKPSSPIVSDEDIYALCFNSILLEEGYAQISTFPPDVKYERQFLTRQQIARDESRGMWNISMEEDWKATNGKDSSTSNTKEPIREEESTYPYIANTSSKKFHLPTCPSVADIKDENILYLESRDEAIDRALDPCKRCNP